MRRIEAQCECVSNTPDPLREITKEEVIREGFPELSPAAFVLMFSRIEFKYV